MKEPTHFIDGTPIPPGYLERVSRAIHEACGAEEFYLAKYGPRGVDVLEMEVRDAREAENGR